MKEIISELVFLKLITSCIHSQEYLQTWLHRVHSYDPRQQMCAKQSKEVYLLENKYLPIYPPCIDICISILCV